MQPSVPLITASFGSRAAMEKAQKAILFLENLIVTITDSSTPDTRLIEKKNKKNVNQCKTGDQ